VPPPKTTHFGTPLVLSRVHWVRPELVAEVTYLIANCAACATIRAREGHARALSSKLVTGLRDNPVTPNVPGGGKFQIVPASGLLTFRRGPERYARARAYRSAAPLASLSAPASYQSRANRRDTCAADHDAPPRGAGMPRSCSADAIPRSDGHAGRPQLGDSRGDVCGPRSRHGPPRGQRRPPSAIVDHVATEASQFDVTGLGGGQRGLGALRDCLRLMLGDGREDMDREAVRLRKVDGYELHAAFHQRRHEMDVSGQPFGHGLGVDLRESQRLLRSSGHIVHLIALAVASVLRLRVSLYPKQSWPIRRASLKAGAGARLGLCLW
jgi:hypothetical protein